MACTLPIYRTLHQSFIIIIIIIIRILLITLGLLLSLLLSQFFIFLYKILYVWRYEACCCDTYFDAKKRVPQLCKRGTCCYMQEPLIEKIVGKRFRNVEKIWLKKINIIYTIPSNTNTIYIYIYIRTSYTFSVTILNEMSIARPSDRTTAHDYNEFRQLGTTIDDNDKFFFKFVSKGKFIRSIMSIPNLRNYFN